MQPLTAAPRDDLTETQVYELLTGDHVDVSAGLELLDTSNRFVADISGDLLVEGSKVTEDGRATINRSCNLKLTRSLAWGRDRVKPYLTLSNAAVSARFDLGVYVLTTPQQKIGESPVTFDVTGFDLLQLLLDGPGDTYVVIPDEGDDVISNSGYEAGIADWESNAAFGIFTVAALASSTSHPSVGSKSLEVTWPTGPLSWVNTWSGGFIVGKTYRFEVDVWVPLDGPDEFRFDVAFTAFSPWFIPTKGTSQHLEWLWTATRPDAFVGLTTHSTTAGMLTYVDEFHAIPLSTTCLDAVAAVVELAGAGAPVRLDGTEQVAVLPGPMVWALTDGQPVTWLQIINDLLGAVNYRPLWCDETGAYRSEPYVDPKSRAVEWTFNASDQGTTLVGTIRTIDVDVWKAPNWWRFVRRGMATTPVEGDGIYTVENLSRGDASQQSIGRVRKKPTQFLDAVDQASLVAQGDRIVVEDTSATRIITINVDPFPIVGHLDVARYLDGAHAYKGELVSAEVCLDGAAGRFVIEVVD